MAQIVACVRYAIKRLCIFITNMKHRLLLGCVRALFNSPWSQSAPVAWHHISPGLLIGLGIYCNAIVLDGIGLELPPMMSSSLNLEALLLCWRPYMGMVHVWGRKWIPKWKDMSDPVKIINMLVIQPLILG